MRGQRTEGRGQERSGTYPATDAHDRTAVGSASDRRVDAGQSIAARCCTHASAVAGQRAFARDAGLQQGRKVMAMKTLTELDAAVEAEREKARQYELLKNQQDGYTRGIAVLQPRIAADEAAIEKLS